MQYGRQTIYTDETEINSDNIVSVLEKAICVHKKNAADIRGLKNYERGNQDILRRKKDIRPEINFKIVENHASEICSFKEGYIFGSPIKYVQRVNSPKDKADSENEGLNELNQMCVEQRKESKDLQLAKDILITGIGHRLIMPISKADKRGASFFEISHLNSETAFIVRRIQDNKAVLGVSFYADSLNNTYYTAYTDKGYFKIDNTAGMFKITDSGINGIGRIPIIEYKNNYEKMGCFERVIPLLNALNNATSDRINGLAQYIQSFIWFNNCDVSEEQLNSLKDKGGLVTKSFEGQTASVQYLTNSLDQQNTQSLADWLYEQILQISGVPGRESSTGGNTGQAIILSNGWQIAETQARTTETVFSESESELLDIIIQIAGKTEIENSVKNLAVSDVEIKFSRNRTDSLIIKTQGLLNMLQAGINPLVSISHCNLFDDPQQVYEDSKPYMKKWEYEESVSVS